jgi:hypothetical protein
MTTDDFKQKCDEIHTILCYLDDNELVPAADIFSPIDVWYGHSNINWYKFINLSPLECAVILIDNIQEIRKDDLFLSDDKWTIKS